MKLSQNLSESSLLGPDLKNLRMPNVTLVEDYLLEQSPVLDHSILEGDVWSRLSSIDSEGLCIAVDLDDTLLHSSQTCPALWDLGGYYGSDIRPGYRYSALTKSAKGWLRALRGRPAYDQVSRRRYPFMEAPRIIVAPNLPLIQMLSVLKTNGARLALATASARKRVDLLFARLPVLRDLFESAVFSAEDLAVRAIEAEVSRVDDLLWEASAGVHGARPRSLMTKTPWALAPLFDGAGYDFLIDDSDITAALFRENGLSDRLIAIDPNAVAPADAWSMVRVCLERFSGRIPPPLPSGLIERTPVLRFEDPLYWPYLHMKDQF